MATPDPVLAVNAARSPAPSLRNRLAARTAIALAILVAGLALTMWHAAIHLGKSDPVRGARLASGNARLATEAARKMAENIARNAEQASELARMALARDATLTPAIETLALAAQQRGDRAEAARLFDLSSRISRRSLATRLWLAQQAVERGQAEVALAHMDLALRTSTQAPAIVFPALERGLADTALEAQIARLVDRPSDWREAFLIQAVDDADAEGATSLLLAMKDREFVAAKGIDRRLVGRLVGERRFMAARRLSDAFRPAGRPGLIADPGFTGTVDRYPFGWGLVEGGAMGAAIGSQGGRPALAYHALPGRSGQVAGQLLMLAPGRYRLATQTAQTGRPAPLWAVACGERGGARLAELSFPARPGASSMAEFTVPPGCEAQWLTLHLAPSIDGEQYGAVASVSLERLRRD